MKTQKIVNLLNGSDNENTKFATKKWCVILTKSIESSLFNYSDAYILVTGNITVTRAIAGNPVQRKRPINAATQVVFKDFALCEKCSTEIDGTLIDEASFINITMPMYNLIEYSDNYSDTSESIWGFKRDEI